MIVYRHADARFPFLWESAAQPPARWHAKGDGPVQYFSSSPDAAWAEFLRHEEINDPVDLATVSRSLWAVELPDERLEAPDLPDTTLGGGTATYPACRAEASRLRARGAKGLVAPSAAIDRRTGSGYRTDAGLRPGPRRAESVIVLFGPRPDLVGWAACFEGRPRPELIGRVRQLRAESVP
jgi:hypothetical protein